MARETELIPCHCGTCHPPDIITDCSGNAFAYCQSCDDETDWCESESAAITAWNTRHTVDPT